MGCGCSSQSKASLPGSPMGPRLFLATSDSEFLRTLTADEFKDKKRLLAYFHMLNEGQFEVTTAFVEQVRRKGVPDRYRWQAWRALSGWSSLYKPGMYERLTQREPARKVVDAVEKDVDRTFPKVEEFDEEKKRHMGSFCRAYACLVPQVGYVQGMNFIAGFLLLASGSSHEDAFFMFVQIMVKYRASLLFCSESLPLLSLMTFQFVGLLEKLFPEVHTHFLCNDITPGMYIPKWMLTVFTSQLDFDSAARIWDVIVCDGIEALVLLCLANIKLLRTRLLKQDTEGILELLSLHKDTTPPTGGDIVQAALNLKLGRGLQDSLSKLRDDWEQKNTDVAAELGRAEHTFCTLVVGNLGLEPPPWPCPVEEPLTEAASGNLRPGHLPEVEPPAGPIITPTLADTATSPIAAPAGAPTVAAAGLASGKVTEFSSNARAATASTPDPAAKGIDLASAPAELATSSIAAPAGYHAGIVAAALVEPSFACSAAEAHLQSPTTEEAPPMASRISRDSLGAPYTIASETKVEDVSRYTFAVSPSGCAQPSSAPRTLAATTSQLPGNSDGVASSALPASAASSSSGPAKPLMAPVPLNHTSQQSQPCSAEEPDLESFSCCERRISAEGEIAKTSVAQPGQSPVSAWTSPSSCRQSLAEATEEVWGTPLAPVAGDFSALPARSDLGGEGYNEDVGCVRVSPRLFL